MLNGLYIDEMDTKRQYKDGRLHRIDGPAIEWTDGHKSWWMNGIHIGHNDDGFWALWDRLTDEQRSDLNLHMYLPRINK